MTTETPSNAKTNPTPLNLGLPIADAPPPQMTPRPANSRGETIAKVGTVLSAIMASSCCWLPLLLLAVGVSGAGIAATLASYRPLFIVVTALFLGAAFYFTYRPRHATAAASSDCCAGEAVQVDCCGNPIVAAATDCCSATAPQRKWGLNMMALNKIMLWAVTVMAVFFLFFPGYVSSWLGANRDVFNGNMKMVILKVDGMWCEGCAPIAYKALKSAPGVLAVEVDYAKKQATVGLDPSQPVDKQSLLNSLKKINFSGSFDKD